MSGRIAGRFARLREQGRKALIPFVTAGDPQPSVTVPLMHALVEAGADLLELGVPFSDPMADGPVIQRASERALEHGVSLRHVLDMVAAFRRRDRETPVVLMGYLNPIEVMGYDAFSQRAAAVGVDGVLTVDLPPEEGGELLERMRAQGVDPIFLVAPTSSEPRIRTICQSATGFVYYVSVKGVTGAVNLDLEPLAAKLQRIREATELPVGVGFGIKDPSTAAAVARVADAVIVGSALVQRMEELRQWPDSIPAEIAGLVRAMRKAMDAHPAHVD